MMIKKIYTILSALVLCFTALNPPNLFAADPFLMESLRRQALRNLGYDHDPKLQYQIDVQRRRSELLRQQHPEVYDAEQDYARDSLQEDDISLYRQKTPYQIPSISKPKIAPVEIKSKETIEFNAIKQAAEQGNPKAQVELGEIFYYSGPSQDYAKSFELFKKAAEQGSAVGQWWLGNMYYEGLGANKSISKAIEWYKKSADQGEKLAQDSLSKLAANNECENAGTPVQIPGAKGTIILDNKCK
jgi:hypothetical protein